MELWIPCGAALKVWKSWAKIEIILSAKICDYKVWAVASARLGGYVHTSGSNAKPHTCGLHAHTWSLLMSRQTRAFTPTQLEGLSIFVRLANPTYLSNSTILTATGNCKWCRQSASFVHKFSEIQLLQNVFPKHTARKYWNWRNN